MLLLTAAQMRALDHATIEGGHVAGAELMERAGRGAAEACRKHFGSPLALRVLVLCGGGNNGGDGFVAARHLHALGARVHVGVVAPRESVRGDARAHLDKLEAAGVRPEFLTGDVQLVNLATNGWNWDWAVDALLGTGAAGEPRGLFGAATRALNLLRRNGVRVVALDLPTGVSADDGAATPNAVHADLTVTFGCLKRGHVLYPGRALCGAIECVDIGLVDAAQAGVDGVRLAHHDAMRALLPVRDPRAHKGSAGRVLVVGGAPGMTGAPVLAARAASRAGAGYVRVAAPASVQDVLAAHLLEPMPLACAETAERSLARFAEPQVLAEAGRADAVALGPGFSRHAESLALARGLLARIAVPLVLDADALAAFAPPETDLAAALRGSPAPRVLTPHLGEMSRLTGIAPAELEARRIDVAGEWARRWGCVLVLKGAPTVVADRDGRTSVNPTGNPGMASAGMGDVLTGTIAALLAQRLAPFEAACLGVFVHGAAGDLVARERGMLGLLAGDVAERLPLALHLLSGATPGAAPA